MHYGADKIPESDITVIVSDFIISCSFSVIKVWRGHFVAALFLQTALRTALLQLSCCVYRL